MKSEIQTIKENSFHTVGVEPRKFFVQGATEAKN